MYRQPKGYANNWRNIGKDEVWIYDGWPHRMTESRGVDKAATGELTPRRIPGPSWAKGYDCDINHVWHWIDRRTQFMAEPYDDRASAQGD